MPKSTDFPILDHLELGELRFEVRNKKGLRDDDGKPLLGDMDFDKELIRIDMARHASDRSRFTTQFHEAGHVLWSRSLGTVAASLIGLLQPRADRVEEVLEVLEEEFVRHTMANLVELLSRNPALLTGLCNMCDPTGKRSR